MENEQHVNEDGQDSEDSTSSCGPDRDGSDFCEEKKESPKPHTPHSNTPKKKLERKRSNATISMLAVAAFAILLMALKGILSQPEIDSSRTDDDIKVKIKVLIQGWQDSYPNQNKETWCTIMGQMIEFTGFDQLSPLVLVMAYDEAFNTTKILASEISHAALLLKNGKDSCGDMDIAKISGSDKRIKPGFLLNNYIPYVEKCRKMIMFNLEKLDGSAAKDLHSLIDPDHPFLHNFVYIFTVKIPSSKGNVYSEVANTLRSHWGAKVEGDKLNPLLSRLVNNIMIFPEPDLEG